MGGADALEQAQTRRDLRRSGNQRVLSGRALKWLRVSSRPHWGAVAYSGPPYWRNGKGVPQSTWPRRPDICGSGIRKRSTANTGPVRWILRISRRDGLSRPQHQSENLLDG